MQKRKIRRDNVLATSILAKKVATCMLNRYTYIFVQKGEVPRVSGVKSIQVF